MDTPRTGAASSGRRPGPQPRFTRDQLVDTAVTLVDQHGFDGLSLRALARTLDVTPMALYRYVQSSDELAVMVIDRLVELKTAQVEIPDDWRAALHIFAATLADLVGEHPALLNAYARGAVHSSTALLAAERLISRLRAAGLSTKATADAYATVHTLTLGHALQARVAPTTDAFLRIDPAEVPELSALLTAGYSVGVTSLHAAVDLVIQGIEGELRQQGVNDHK